MTALRPAGLNGRIGEAVVPVRAFPRGSRLHRAARFPRLCGWLLANVRRMSSDAAAKYFWHEAPVAERLRITQVYGYLICPTNL
jgi:hypothetical protein